MNEDQRYNVIRVSNTRGDVVPEYLKNVTLREIYNYYFNWHMDQELVLIDEIHNWYFKARNWTWEPA
jgi:hypothetical protein